MSTSSGERGELALPQPPGVACLARRGGVARQSGRRRVGELYLILTGRLPFQGREGELVHAILHEEPEAPHEYNPRVPRALGEVCQRMLRKQPEQRYADARAVDAVLAEVFTDTRPWTVEGVEGVEWMSADGTRLRVLRVWQPQSLTPGDTRQIVVEAEAPTKQIQGTFVLKLGEVGGPRISSCAA